MVENKDTAYIAITTTYVRLVVICYLMVENKDTAYIAVTTTYIRLVVICVTWCCNVDIKTVIQLTTSILPLSIIFTCFSLISPSDIVNINKPTLIQLLRGLGSHHKV